MTPIEDRLAVLLHRIASRGEAYPSIGIMANRMRQRSSAIGVALHNLVRLGRLIPRVSIDGIAFGKEEKMESNSLEELKTHLRRKFRCVVDARVVDKPDSVPRGACTELLIEGRRVSIQEAEDML